MRVIPAVVLALWGLAAQAQANVRSGGKAVPLVQRAEDAQFRSVFIISNPAVKTLADLKGNLVHHRAPRATIAAVAAARVKVFYTPPVILTTTGRYTPICPKHRATRFIVTRAENYAGIEQAARSAGLLQ